MAGASNSGASNIPRDYSAAPRTRIPAFAGGPAADSTSQGGIPPLQTVAPAKKKRGRPRKYRLDGSLNLAIPPKPTSSSIGEASKFELENPGQLLASSVGAIINLDPDEDTIVLPKTLIHEDQTQHPQEVEHQVSEAATTFTPHISIITVKAGENVTTKVMSLCQKEPEAICILSANGVISSATISQPQSSEKLSTYEGKYEIISLSGSFMPNGSRSGGVSVSLAGLDGHVVGGCVAGPLMATSPVNVVVGSFLVNEQHEQKLEKQKHEVTSTVTPMAAAPVSTDGQLLASSVGAAFTPHIIIVNAGEVITPRVLTTAADSNEHHKSGPWLPTEVLSTKIFTRFPTLSNIRSWKMVSKDWNFAASHPEYARWHNNHASQGLLFMDAEELVPHGLANAFLENINHPYTVPIYSTPWIDAHGQINSRRYKISNSIGGLVGLYNGSARDPVMVWNPITGVYHRVPGVDMDTKAVIVALGRQEDNSCYKLLRLSSLDYIFDLPPPITEVFTLGTQNWRAVEGGHNFVYVKPHPVCINGCIYFLVTYADDPPVQMRLVCFNVENENFVDQVLPQDPNHPEASFTRGHVSIGMVDGLLYILKCEWQGGYVGIGLPGNNAFIQADVRVWVFENDAWRVLIDNVRVPTDFSCPQLFQTPKRERSYIIYTQNTNRMVIFEGPGVPLQRYHLDSRTERRYTAIQHTPSLLPMNESLALHQIETERCAQGIDQEVRIDRIQ